VAFWLKGYNLSTGKTTLVLLFNIALVGHKISQQ